jgi:hypothetical protein
MISKACLATLLAIGVQGAWAQCADITAQVTYGAATSIMVSAATRATITDPVRQSQDVSLSLVKLLFSADHPDHHTVLCRGDCWTLRCGQCQRRYRKSFGRHSESQH